MPLLLIALFLADLLSLLFLGLDIYLWREWYVNKDTVDDEYARRCLIGAIALLIYLLFAGKTIIKAILSKSRKGEVEPKAERSSDQQEIRRPDGTLINVEHYGDKGKQAIIFIHGWNSNSMQWFYQKRYFSKEYHLILMDLPGLGKSRRPDNKDFSLEKLASDLNAVIKNTKAKDPILWGHSMGGMTILTFCKVFKEKQAQIQGIVLEHTTYTNPTRTAILSKLLTRIQNPILKPLCWLMIVFSPLVWLSRWLSYANGNMLIMTRFLTFAGTQTSQQLDFTSLLSAMAPPAITARGVLGMFNYEATDILPQISIPSLIVAANTDKLTKAEASRAMDGLIPGSKMITLAPAGHMGLMERHQEVNQAVDNFLRGLKKLDNLKA